jgi:hypothetical protein
MRMKTRFVLLLWLLALFTVISSCGDDGGPNIAPDTQLTASPPEGTAHSYLVHMAWKGTDPDGWVTGYEFGWHSGSLTTAEFESLAWVPTSTAESTFTVLADTCCVPGGDNYHGHTFLVRAIDNDGAKDESPAYVSFTATTEVPKTTITYPDWPHGTWADTLPPWVTVRWEGDDPDGEVVEYRYAWKRYEDPPWHLPPAFNDPSRWSPWSPENKVIRELTQTDPENPWSFYVQSKDNAGAIETVFKEGDNFIVIFVDPEKVNLPSISVCCNAGPCFGKQGPTIACRSTADTTKMDIPVEVSVGDTICFTTTTGPGKYARIVTDIQYRYNDPGEPGSWLDATKSENLVYPPSGQVFIVSPFINTLYIWVRDDYAEFGSTRRAHIMIDGVLDQ